MELHTLKPAEGAVKKGKRIGRGPGSGKGGTSTRGHKGAKSRSGYKQKRGFEGGQMPLQRRIPIFGFKNTRKIVFKAINLDALQALADKLKVEEMDFAFFQQNGLVGKNDQYKILANGALKSKLNIAAHACSASAVKAIEAAGGKVTLIK